MGRVSAFFSKNWQTLLFLVPAFLYLLGFLLIILYQVIILSVTRLTPAGQPFVTLENYRALVLSTELSQALVNTSLFALVGTPLVLAFGLSSALLVNRAYRGVSLVRTAFILPLAIPSLVTATVLFIMFDFPGGHINDLLTGRYSFSPGFLTEPVNFRASALTSLGVALGGKVWRDMPIAMLILLSGLNSIGRDLYEAAAVLGAGRLRAFFKITLPLLLPAISIVLLLRAIEMWKEFIFPFILAARFPMLATLIERAYHEWNSPFMASALSLVLVAVTLVSSLILYYGLAFLRSRVTRA